MPRWRAYLFDDATRLSRRCLFTVYTELVVLSRARISPVLLSDLHIALVPCKSCSGTVSEPFCCIPVCTPAGMLLASPPLDDNPQPLRKRAAAAARSPASVQPIFSFPEPLELQFLDAQCKGSTRHSIAVRAIFGTLGVAAAVPYFLLNELPNHVR